MYVVCASLSLSLSLSFTLSNVVSEWIDFYGYEHITTESLENFLQKRLMSFGKRKLLSSMASSKKKTNGVSCMF
jgi:hypothetical protein